MGSFAYVAPKTVRETTATLAELSGSGTPIQIMAGGTDMKLHRPLKPGDVLTARNGLSVEINNTSVRTQMAKASCNLSMD